jgi:hypothetical protein
VGITDGTSRDISGLGAAAPAAPAQATDLRELVDDLKAENRAYRNRLRAMPGAPHRGAGARGSGGATGTRPEDEPTPIASAVRGGGGGGDSGGGRFD